MNAFRRINAEVYVADRPFVHVDRARLDLLKHEADRNPRRRVRLCAHRSPEDRLHEMLIVLARQVYIRPHKHPGKSESFHVIEGTAQVVFFDDGGRIEEVLEVGDAASGRPFYFRNEDERFHTQIITSDHLVFHETTNGPFNRNDTLFAPWSPDESDPAAIARFLDQLRSAVAAKLPPSPHPGTAS